VATNTEYQAECGERGEVFEHASRMVDEARAFGTAVSGSIENLGRNLDLRGRVERHPIGMVLAAIGVGYVLGGGLFSATTSRLLRVGVRLALVPIIKNQLSVLTAEQGPAERASESGAV
jgi:hypothetical protein